MVEVANIDGANGGGMASEQEVQQEWPLNLGR
jgi:hypothetical protein